MGGGRGESAFLLLRAHIYIIYCLHIWVDGTVRPYILPSYILCGPACTADDGTTTTTRVRHAAAGTTVARAEVKLRITPYVFTAR